jgi:hypothetical protein
MVACIHSIVAQTKALSIFESFNFHKYLNLLASFISWSSILTIRCDHIMSFQSLFLDKLPLIVLLSGIYIFNKGKLMSQSVSVFLVLSFVMGP